MKHLIWLTLVALSVWGCKKGVTNCNYVVTPWVQTTDKGDLALCVDAIGYGFYADTSEWTVTSYDNALAGVITSRTDAQTKQYDFKVEQNELGKLIIGPFTKRGAMVIVCDVTNRFYAWRYADIGEGLPEVVVPVRFLLWKPMISYEDTRWTVVNEFYVPAEPEPEPEPEPTPDPDPTPEA